MDHCDDLNLSQLDTLQRQIRFYRNAKTQLMSLPGELRNKIYDQVLQSEIIDPTHGSPVDLDTLKILLFGPALGQVCHQLRTETRAIRSYSEKAEISKFDSSRGTFAPVSLDALGCVLQRATWFRAISSRDVETARKSVRVCDEELNLDYCGTVSFGSKSGVRPLWFVASLRTA